MKEFQLYRGFRKIGAALRALKQGTPEAIPDGFVPISQFSSDDIFIVGYPKSGNTWFQQLVAGVVYGVDPKWSPFALVRDLVPDASALKYYRRYATPMFFKSHSLPRREFRRVVYLLRDGRDAMVSYRYYREVVDRVQYDFQKFVSPETDLYPCHWPRHVEAWAKNPYEAQILLIKYEDLLDQPVEQLKRFCGFVGISRETDHLEAVAEAASFCNLRGKEAKEGSPDPDFEADKFFFRRGIVGSHRDEMPPEALKMFLGQAGETLRRYGYDIGLRRETSVGGHRARVLEVGRVLDHAGVGQRGDSADPLSRHYQPAGRARPRTCHKLPVQPGRLHAHRARSLKQGQHYHRQGLVLLEQGVDIGLEESPPALRNDEAERLYDAADLIREFGRDAEKLGAPSDQGAQPHRLPALHPDLREEPGLGKKR